MDDQTFLAFVVNNAPACEVETLRKAIEKLNENIGSRVFGRPPGLEIDSHIEVTELDGNFPRYGAVIRLSDKGCIIEPPTGTCTERISFKKQIVRILDKYEWNRVVFAAEAWDKRRAEERARELKEEEREYQRLIAARDSAKRVVMEALNGPVELYAGAYIHAHDPKYGLHLYGVVAGMSPKRVSISYPGTTCGIDAFWAAKYEITVLNDRQWLIVDRELQRRKREYDEAERDGTTDAVPDYSEVAIRY